MIPQVQPLSLSLRTRNLDYYPTPVITRTNTFKILRGFFLENYQNDIACLYIFGLEKVKAINASSKLERKIKTS